MADDTARLIAYHDTVCSPNCGDDISTYPTPPDETRRSKMDDLTELITQAIRDADADTLDYERRTPDYGYGTHAAAVMSVVAPAIQAAKAEAWDEAASHAESKPWITNFRADDLRTANPYRETGDQA